MDGASNSNTATASDIWQQEQITTQWDPETITPYPPHAILPSHNLNTIMAALSTLSNAATLPQSYTSREGFSSTTRNGSGSSNSVGKTVIGYYAAWQWYDNAERASPMNMQFNKVDRVNFAFFQVDGEGRVWGTDSVSSSGVYICMCICIMHMFVVVACFWYVYLCIYRVFIGIISLSCSLFMLFYTTTCYDMMCVQYTVG